MYQFYLILPIVSSSGYDNNSWKQLIKLLDNTAWDKTTWGNTTWDNTTWAKG